MKKVLIIILLLLLPVTYGDNDVTIPEFDVIIKGVVVDKTHSTYPIFTYKNITYVPMTSDYVKGLGLRLEYSGERGLNILKVKAQAFVPMFNDGDYEVGQSFKVTTVPFDVKVDNKKIQSDYPLLFYKDIVYMPLTWEIAHDILGFDYEFNGILFIGGKRELLELDRVHVSIGEDISKVGITFALDHSEDYRLYIDDLEEEIPYEYSETSDKYIYKLIVDDLKEDTTYRFRVGNDQVISTYYHFKSLPDDEVEMAYFGDIQAYSQKQYMRFRENYEMAKDFDMAYIAGDLVDRGDSLIEWTYFHKAMADTNLEILATCMGNHDTYGTPENYIDSFNYPDNGSSNKNYYFDLPHARVAVINTEGSHTRQKEWLKEIMDVDKFKLVFMHRSLYPIKYDGSSVRDFYGTFDEVGIDLVLSGHDHIYSRTQMKDDKKDDQGTYYVVGGSGSGSKYYEQAVERSWQDVVYDEDNPVFVKVMFLENKIQVKAYAIEDEITLIDEFTLE
ncbi:metallophosphoesterase family protein [Acidaminobacter sp. JC074]|uniref:FN3 domain-containing metallophosphoesterase family protein n=1 Tax=Acidaminobacter sp. JC074 TaxID=2530199 RepID=UPI001F0DEE99|nr:FN3 domain-containing metallophosphoesterase family protein [Acidaminobacter sp. JC074]MCH4890823.1 metallophosphoesterase family protein [Acidaminobacter sp. JC074]